METRIERMCGDCKWEEYLEERKPIYLGWNTVPNIDGGDCYMWDDVARKTKTIGLGSNVDRD